MYVIPGTRKVYVTSDDVSDFNAQWPCSTLRDTRAYWFEFDTSGDLIDCDVPEQDNGPAASAMADDCRAYIMDNSAPEWLS